MASEKHDNPKSQKLPADHSKLEIQIEELEPIEVPGWATNSNDTLISDVAGE